MELLSIVDLKNGTASTLDIVTGVKGKLVESMSTLPDNPGAVPVNDQSVFVRAAIKVVAFYPLAHLDSHSSFSARDSIKT